MFRILRKDWQTNRNIVFWFLVYLTLMFNVRSDLDLKEMAVYGIICASMVPFYLWFTEGKYSGRTLSCSLPIKRKSFIRGSYLTCWTFGLTILFFTFLNILLKVYIFNWRAFQFPELMQVKVLLLSLWIPTVVMLLFFPFCSWFGTKKATTTFLIIFISIAGLILVSLMLPLRGLTDPDQSVVIQFFQTTIQSIVQLHNESYALLLSGIALVVVNLITVRISEFLFKRNDVVA